jgi:hypothetical protein
METVKIIFPFNQIYVFNFKVVAMSGSIQRFNKFLEKCFCHDMHCIQIGSGALLAQMGNGGTFPRGKAVRA